MILISLNSVSNFYSKNKCKSIKINEIKNFPIAVNLTVFFFNFMKCHKCQKALDGRDSCDLRVKYAPLVFFTGPARLRSV